MDLPNELIITIFNFITKITDKRQFIKTCKLHNSLLKHLITNMNECELDYFRKSDLPRSIVQTYNMYYPEYLSKREYCVERFTIELCYDSYFDRIPISYFHKYNEVIIRLLIKQGNLELLQIAFENLCKLDGMSCLIATEYGQINVLKWLKKKNIFNNSHNNCVFAALYGHLNILIWLRKKGCIWDTETCAYAALNGHLDVLKWSRENGCVWTLNICAYAAYSGHLNVLKWARDHGASWGTWTCANAAMNGHLDVLKWARNNGCPWNEDTWIYAQQNGNLDVINWLRENSCSGSQ